jgi:signal transduction histidine kinase/ActR/RegA family two-component response regulator
LTNNEQLVNADTMGRALAALLVGAICWIASRQAFAGPAPHVLVLNSYHPQYTWTEELIRGVRDDFTTLPPEHLHIEFMDARRMVDDESYLEALATLYRHKFTRLPPDIIISSDDSALNFLLQRRDSLFPGIPVVFCGINSRAPEELEAVPNMTGILEGLDVAGNLALIRRLHPDAQRVVLLADRTSLGQGMAQVARGAIDRFETPSLKVDVWDDFTLDELGQRMAATDSHSVFLLLAIHEDRAGRYFSFTEDLEPLTRRSRAPVYAMFGMLLGQGVTGGMMNDPYEHGRATASMARKVLAGTPADAIPVVASAEYRPRFDYALLQRFGIPEARLPSDSLVLGKPISFYEQHTRLVWGAAAVFAALIATIGWLTYLIRRLRKAERELIAKQAELHRAQQLEMMGSLAGGVAHDFNNIITAIAGFAELASYGVSRCETELRDNLDQIGRASQRAAGLTRQLLSFARRQPIEPRVVDLNELVKESQKLLRRLLWEDIELVILPAAEPACVFADPGQLEQVLGNLATNARDAMPSGGKFTLAISLDAAKVVLRATDTGMGMAQDVISRIFEPFFTTKSVGRGTGLGLATSFSIVEQAKGSIAIESKPGLGSTFIICLPRRLEPPERLVAPARSSPRTRVSGLVLLVEDDAQVRGVARRALENQGLQVLEAENGAVAIALASQGRKLSCVLTDVVTPIMGGVELVRRVRALDRDVPVIVMSGYVDDASLFAEAGQLGVSFIAKPFLPSDLVTAVCDAIGRRKAPAELRQSV